MKTTNVLILGGITEAYALAEELAPRTQFRVISSLAGRTNDPRPPSGEFRVGGFGGVEGLREFLTQTSIHAVVDATHPFAATMGKHAALACRAEEVPLLRLERPAWEPVERDRWYPVADWDQAIERLRALNARRVLLALGARELQPFSVLSETWFLLRTVTPPNPMPPFAAAELLIARGPFDQNQELELLRSKGIDTIVCRNSGGQSAFTKLLAAREQGITAVMRNRPARPRLPTVNSVAAVIRWLEGRDPAPGQR